MGKEQWQLASADWLPEGWKVEVRRRSTGKIDKCYTDPSNEYKFNSKPEVLRYLKYTKTTSQPSALAEIKANIAESPAELNKESGVTDKGNESSGHSLSAVKANIAESPADLNKESVVTDKGNESSGRSVAAESEEKMVAGSQSQQLAINKQSLITETGGLKNDDQAPSNNLKEGVKAVKPKGGQKRKNVKAENQPRRASRRIAGIEADDISLEPPTVLTRPRRSAGTRPDHAEVDSNPDKGKKPGDSPSPEQETNNQNTDVVLTGVQNSAGKKTNHAEVDNKGKKPADSEEPANNQNTEVVLDVPFSELLNDPCIEFAFKTLTGEMPLPIEDEKPALAEGAADQGPEHFPATDIWADPCFEFAVKTLTGDLPVDTAVLNPPPSNGVQSATEANKNKQTSSTGR